MIGGHAGRADGRSWEAHIASTEGDVSTGRLEGKVKSDGKQQNRR